MKLKKLPLLLIPALFSLAACNTSTSLTSRNTTNTTNSSTTNSTLVVTSAVTSEANTTSIDTSASYFDSGDLDNSEDSTSGTISLNGTSGTSTTTLATVNSGVVTIAGEGNFEITGTFNGYIVVDASSTSKVTLTLNNANITSSNFAPIYVKNADKVTLYLKNSNSLKNTSSFTQIDSNNVDGALYSKDDLMIKGNGSLEVTSSIHGIVAKDDLKLVSGTIKITASGGHGIDANDSVRNSGAELEITSAKDGIHVENTDDTTLGYFYMDGGKVDINASYDGIDTSCYIYTNGGEYNITLGGGSSKSASSSNSTKGLKSNGEITLNAGTYEIASADDAIHSNYNININGGTYTLSSGDDGIHADSNLIIADGTVKIKKSYEGIEATSINISGGNISVVASDDGLNAAGGNDSSSMGGRIGQGGFASSSGTINISGGELYVNSAGDGVDSNGNLYVSGGTTFVEGPTDNGNGPLDYDGTGSITGGTFVAIGSSGMAMNFSTASQGSALITVSGKSGDKIACSNYFSFTSSKSYASVLVSCPSFAKGSTYSITTSSNSTSVTFSSYIYGSSSQGGGQFPDQGGRMFR